MSITLEQVTKRYQGQPVVNDVSLTVAEGEFFVLLGPSGSGKSTLLRAIAGLVDIDDGTIALHGSDVTHVGARQRGVGFVESQDLHSENRGALTQSYLGGVMFELVHDTRS